MKRSVYVPVFRNVGYEMFNVFDFANPNFTVGKRAESTIPTQMLFMTNSEFVHARAEGAASQLLQLPATSPRERITAAFRQTLGRGPSEKELAIAMDFVKASKSGPDGHDAWAGLQRTLFGSVDFRTLR